MQVVEPQENNKTGTVIGSVQLHEQKSPTPTVSSSSSPIQTDHPSPSSTHQTEPHQTPSLIPPAPRPPPLSHPITNAHAMQTRAKTKITKPALKLTLFAATKTKNPTIPTTVAQAM